MESTSGGSTVCTIFAVQVLTLKLVEKLSSRVRMMSPTSLASAPWSFTFVLTCSLAVSERVRGSAMAVDRREELGEDTPTSTQYSELSLIRVDIQETHA